MDHITKAPKRQQLAGELNELAIALGKLHVEQATCQAQLRDADAIAGKTDLRVDAALEFSKTGDFTAVGSDLAELLDRELHIRLQIDAVQKAFQDRQSELEAVDAELSVQACKDVSTRHRAIAKDFMTALEAMDAAQQAEHDLFHEMYAAGYSTSAISKTVAWPQVGRLSDTWGSAAYYKAKELAVYAK